MKRTLIALGAIAVLFSACKKDDSTSASGGKKGSLTTGKWRITSSTSVIEYPAPIGTQTVNLFSSIQPCMQDNLYIFNSDGTNTTDEGATKCNTSDAQTKSSGTWQLLNSDTQLKVTEGSNTVTGDIQTLDNSSLVLKYVTTANGIKSTTTTSYAHQ
jgi:hypothetical protein